MASFAEFRPVIGTGRPTRRRNRATTPSPAARRRRRSHVDRAQLPTGLRKKRFRRAALHRGSTCMARDGAASDPPRFAGARGGAPARRMDPPVDSCGPRPARARPASRRAWICSADDLRRLAGRYGRADVAPLPPRGGGRAGVRGTCSSASPAPPPRGPRSAGRRRAEGVVHLETSCCAGSARADPAAGRRSRPRSRAGRSRNPELGSSGRALGRGGGRVPRASGRATTRRPPGRIRRRLPGRIPVANVPPAGVDIGSSTVRVR